MIMFLFLVVALVLVVGAVTLAVVGGGENGPLPEAAPERLRDPLPPDRPVDRADVEGLRFPLAAPRLPHGGRGRRPQPPRRRARRA